jgi:hypothetical protein
LMLSARAAEPTSPRLFVLSGLCAAGPRPGYSRANSSL